MFARIFQRSIHNIDELLNENYILHINNFQFDFKLVFSSKI